MLLRLAWFWSRKREIIKKVKTKIKKASLLSKYALEYAREVKNPGSCETRPALGQKRFGSRCEKYLERLVRQCNLPEYINFPKSAGLRVRHRVHTVLV